MDSIIILVYQYEQGLINIKQYNLVLLLLAMCIIYKDLNNYFNNYKHDCSLYSHMIYKKALLVHKEYMLVMLILHMVDNQFMVKFLRFLRSRNNWSLVLIYKVVVHILNIRKLLIRYILCTFFSKIYKFNIKLVLNLKEFKRFNFAVNTLIYKNY